MNALRLILLSCSALSLAACGSADDAASGDSAKAATPGSDRIPAYSETGKIVVSNGTDHKTWYTTANTVPGQVGREVHTASWLTMAGIGQTGPFAPNDIFVSLSARPSIEPDPDLPDLKIEFSLDPDTLQAKQGVPVKVSVEPDGASPADEVTDAELRLDRAERVEESVLNLAGRVTGRLKGQPFSADFTIDRAVGRASSR